MNRPLQVLIVADSDDDAALLVRTLRDGGFDPVHARVDSEADLREALSGGQWEIILCGHPARTPDFSRALEIAKDFGVEGSIIVVSDTSGEEIAVRAMKAGAHDYLLKDDLARLAPAVKRELREAEERSRKRRDAQALETASLELEGRVQERAGEVAATKHASQETTRALQTLIGASPVAIVALDRNELVTMWNPTAEAIFGWTESEVLGKPYLAVPDSEREAYKRQVEAEFEGQTFFDLEVTRRRKSGELFQASLASAPLRDQDGTVVGSVSLLTDISERKRAEGALRESEQRLRDLVEGSIEGILVHRDHKPLLVNEAWAEIHGYTIAEVMAMESVVPLMAPHDRERTVEYKKARLPVRLPGRAQGRLLGLAREPGAPGDVGGIARDPECGRRHRHA
jgi:PAS domain S-box-containing protein